MPRSQQPPAGEQIVLSQLQSLSNIKILDVGAGDGKWGNLLSPFLISNDIQIDAVEIHPPNAKALCTDIYTDIMQGDICDVSPYKLKEYDIIILGDVLEHIPYDKAIQLISILKYVEATIYLTLPISLCNQGPVDGNIYETHVYQWKDKEVEALGFKELHRGFNPNGLVEIGTYILENTEIQEEWC